MQGVPTAVGTMPQQHRRSVQPRWQSGDTPGRDASELSLQLLVGASWIQRVWTKAWKLGSVAGGAMGLCVTGCLEGMSSLSHGEAGVEV